MPKPFPLLFSEQFHCSSAEKTFVQEDSHYGPCCRENCERPFLLLSLLDTRYKGPNLREYAYVRKLTFILVMIVGKSGNSRTT